MMVLGVGVKDFSRSLSRAAYVAIEELELCEVV